MCRQLGTRRGGPRFGECGFKGCVCLCVRAFSVAFVFVGKGGRRGIVGLGGTELVGLPMQGDR